MTRWIAAPFPLLLALWAGLSEAQVPLRETSVEQYRVRSHYGPDEALLSPLFPREGKMEFSGGAGLQPLSSLSEAWFYQGSMLYHINRRHAVEPVLYVRNNNSFSGFLQEQVADKISASERAETSIEVPNQFVMASYFFTPYHAKLHLSSRSVSHFDLYFGLGAGAVQTQQLFLNENEGDSSWGAAGVLTAGVRMLFRPRFALRFEARDFIYRAENFAERSTVHNFQFAASLSIFFGSF